ncbi:hypothetical protein LSH36_10g12000, partial [Paralvinella palmiformis]
QTQTFGHVTGMKQVAVMTTPSGEWIENDVSRFKLNQSMYKAFVLRRIKHLHSPLSRLLSTQQQQSNEQTKWREEAIFYVHDTRLFLVKETETLLKLSNIKTIKSVFFGGGTPSLAEPLTIQSVLETVERCTHLIPGAEITLEANPTSAESTKLREFKDAGVNRLSLGIQSLIDEDLRVLGRQHSITEALNCLEIAKSLFPGRTSVDIIFGRPSQQLTVWEEELDEVLNLCNDHLSVYQLTLEKGTVLFKQVMERVLLLPPQEMIDDMYELLVEKSAQRGYHRYEVSNFAKHHSSESIHNKGYWQSIQYIGVGPARIQTLVPDRWMSEVERYGHGTQKVTPQTEHTVLQEVIMLGMRTAAGITDKQWRIFTDIGLRDVFGESRMVRVLKDEGYLEFSKAKGRFLKGDAAVATQYWASHSDWVIDPCPSVVATLYHPVPYATVVPPLCRDCKAL